MKCVFFVCLLIFPMTVTPLPSDVIALGDHEIVVEIADTEASRYQGLMFRRELPEGKGMLFVHEKPQIVMYWMKNTYIPLSIAFFDEKNVLLNIEEMAPSERGAPIKQALSAHPALYALEVPQGWFKRHNIKPGMKFSFRDPQK